MAAALRCGGAATGGPWSGQEVGTVFGLLVDLLGGLPHSQGSKRLPFALGMMLLCQESSRHGFLSCRWWAPPSQEIGSGIICFVR